VHRQCECLAEEGGGPGYARERHALAQAEKDNVEEGIYEKEMYPRPWHGGWLEEIARSNKEQALLSRGGGETEEIGGKMDRSPAEPQGVLQGRRFYLTWKKAWLR